MKPDSVHRICEVALAAAQFMLFMSPAFAGDSAAPSTAPAGQAKAVMLTPFVANNGSAGKRIVLSAKAAERLDIQTGKIGEEVVVRKQMVSGMVVYPQGKRVQPGATGGGFGGFGGAAQAAPVAEAGAMMKKVVATPADQLILSAAGNEAAAKESIVVVNLSPGEYERIAKDKPARIVPLYTRDKGVKEMIAHISANPPLEDAKRSMLTLHYQLPHSEHGLPASTRVRVELQMAGTEDKQKVVPYNAVYYDAKGAPWVYVNTAPLTYERQRITVSRVVGNVAVLSDGPALGTPVVTVGAALLYGTEIFGK